MVESESQDWINKLPCCILSSIISLLSIKDAVDTCLVSHHWRNLWKHAILTGPDLVLDIANIFGSVYAPLVARHERYYTFAGMTPRFERECYIKRVNGVLELYSGNKLDSFKVAFFLDEEDTQVLDKWVRFAITKGAQKLDLRLFKDYLRINKGKYVFPHWILADLNVSTLKHLSLYRCVLGPPADFDRFVQLTTLYLNDVEVDPNFLAHISSASSLLESLALINCIVCSDLIIGPSLHLHDLKVLTCHRLGRIVINAVNLSSLEFDGSHTQISFMRTPKLVSFFFRGWMHGPLPNVLTLLTSCPKLTTLQLHIRNYFPHIPQNFPALRNLKQLKLYLFMLDFELGSVVNILRGAPLLEELLMTVHAPNYHGDIRNLCTFSHNHLRKVEMQAFQGMWSEIEFAIYLLKIATKLEVMVIDPLGSLYDGNGTWFDIECCYEYGNEYEHPEESEELYPSDDDCMKMADSERCLLCWQKRGKAAVQERLKEVKTDAQVIIL